MDYLSFVFEFIPYSTRKRYEISTNKRKLSPNTFKMFKQSSGLTGPSISNMFYNHNII